MSLSQKKSAKRTSDRKTVLLVSLAFPPSHGGGGLRNFRTYQRIRHLIPIDLVVITEAGRHYHPGWSSYQNIPVYAVPPTNSAASLVQALPAFLKGGGARRYAAMHIAGFSKMAQLIGLAGQAARIPVIAEMTVDPDPPGHRLRDRIAMWPVTNAKLLIALTSTIRDWFISVGAAPDRIWQRPNPVDVNSFHPPTEAERCAARAHFGIPEGTCLHVVFGRFQPRKNQRLAVKALSRLPPPHHLLLVGPTFAEDQDYLASLRGEVEELGLQRRVTILAETVAEAPAVYHAADQLWLTSTLEGLPNVMLEALCCGVPVVANSQLKLHEYVVDYVNGRQSPPVPSEFATAALSVVTLSESTDARCAIADLARRTYGADQLDAQFARHLAVVTGLRTQGAGE